MIGVNKMDITTLVQRLELEIRALQSVGFGGFGCVKEGEHLLYTRISDINFDELLKVAEHVHKVFTIVSSSYLVDE